MQIALPSGLQGGLDVILISFATFFVSQISNDNIAALGIGVGYIILFYPITAIFSVGTNVLIARNFGAKNFESIKKIFSSMFFSSFIVGIPTMALSIICMPIYAHFIGLSENLKDLFFSYILISTFSIPAISAKNVIISAFAATNDAKRPFNIKLIILFISIFCHYCLILGNFGCPRLGLNGAAIVNIFVNYLELFLLLFMTKIIKTHIKLKMILDKAIIKSGISIGYPTCIERLFTIFSITIFLKFIAHYAEFLGDSVIVGYQAGSRIETISFVPAFGFTVAAMSLIGHSLGARKFDRMKNYINLSLIISSALFAIIGIILAISSKFVSGVIINNDELAIKMSVAYLIAVGLSQAPQIVSFVYDGVLRGGGYTKVPLYVNVFSIIILRYIPMFICTYFSLNIYFLFFIIFLETYIRAFIFHIITRKIFSKYFM